jgi:rubredoxin
MDYLLYTIGLIVGIGIFIYLTIIIREGKDRIKRSPNVKPAQPDGDISVEPQSIAYKNMQAYPRERVCPLCGALLSKYESLYAHVMESGEGRKLMIYGCRFCYKQDEDPDKKRKNEI